jgi:UDP-N-acetylmuramyl pentapeptide synthase
VRIESIAPRGSEGSELRLAFVRESLTVRVPIVGRHNAENAACAMAIALALNVDLARAADGISRARAAKHRSEVADVAGRHVLVDCYNANPSSMRAAIDTLGELSSKRGAVAVLGDMLELGDAEADEHARVGFALAGAGVDRLIAIGPRAKHIAGGARKAGVREIVETEDPAAAARTIVGWTKPGDWILVKASRGMRLERVVEAMRAQLAEVHG